jgi:hypothetical protein
LLHTETHRSDQEIGISANEGFAFMELMDELIPLNGLTGLRLLVVVAAGGVHLGDQEAAARPRVQRRSPSSARIA